MSKAAHPSARQSTSVTLDRRLLDEARELGLNLSRAAEAGLAAAIRSDGDDARAVGRVPGSSG